MNNPDEDELESKIKISSFALANLLKSSFFEIWSHSVDQACLELMEIVLYQTPRTGITNMSYQTQLKEKRKAKNSSMVTREVITHFLNTSSENSFLY